MNKLAFYCRAGFEKELAAEITDKATQLGVFGFARLQPQTGYVIYECYQPGEADFLARKLAFQQLIFARQMLVVSDLLTDLPQQDRISPIIAQYQQWADKLPLTQSDTLWVETADTNEAKELLTFCAKFTVPLRQACRRQGWLKNETTKRGISLHIFFIQSQSCYVGYSYNANHSAYFMGIPRLKFPAQAPSRSTLKLEEAILTFIPREQERQRMNDSMVAVDLGACPGGWTYQLVKRGLFVYAVDHGKLAESLHQTGRVEHCPEDGFKFQPPKKTKVNWLVCDMVEQPKRVMALMANWLVKGWCQEAIFNLKLPMKKRYLEVQQCLQLLDNQLCSQQIKYQLQAKHLYHDREEITIHIKINKE